MLKSSLIMAESTRVKSCVIYLHDRDQKGHVHVLMMNKTPEIFMQNYISRNSIVDLFNMNFIRCRLNFLFLMKYLGID